jgi:hypothetical protein
VEDLETRRAYVSRDIIFEEGLPRRSLASVGEQMPRFKSVIDNPPTNIPAMEHLDITNAPVPVPERLSHQPSVPVNPVMPQDIPGEPRRSARVHQPSNAEIQSAEYRQ